MVVKILIDNAAHKLNKVYDYKIKEEHEEVVEIGKRVRINFGSGKGSSREGIIVKILKDEESDKLDKLKCVEEILDENSYLDEKRLSIAKWMSKMYFCNVYTALKLMLPPTPNKKLEQKELVGKQITVVTLDKTKEEIEQDIENKKITSARHIKLLRELEENNNIPIEDIINTLGISRNIIKTVESKGYINLIKQDATIEDYSKVERSEKLEPTREQKRTIDGIIRNLDTFKVSLIHGITGSGKTEVYLQIIEECLNRGKDAIVLVPEISLTDQTKRRFISRFGEVVSVLHSKMTALERQTEYKRIVNGKAKIVIGPRSALFVPFKNLGLIIIDEEHDTSYISQTTPKYNTREVATRLAYLNNANLVLGSATPDVCTMYKAMEEKIDYYSMLTRPGASVVPEVEIVDMKQDAVVNKSRILSTRLKEEIEENIKRKEQAFVFLNRRGFSSYITCKTCGKTLRCPNCDVNLTYHRKNGLLLCHYCSYCEKVSDVCPICSADTLEEGGMGTERVEKELLETFPGITTLRLDMDTTVKRGSHERILNEFKDKNVDVLVGTQMISKGHDIANVTLVGVVNADYMAGDDYTVSEKAFSNLLQVAGRAGRGDKKGRVILQAYDTENYILNSVRENSYLDFYEQEIKFRKMAGYPPFVDIVVVELTSKDKTKLMKDSEKIYNIFSKEKNLYKVHSPKAPYISKINNKYRIQMVIKTKVDNKVLDKLIENMDIYDKIKDVSVTASVVKNPVRLG